MADQEFSIIKHNDHHLLDQALLRLPNELLRKNFRSAHFTIEKDTSALKTNLKDSATAAISGRATQADVLKNIDAMLNRMRGVKRKLTTLADEEEKLYGQLAARISHLNDLWSIRSVEEVKYEAWSRKRLDRLVAEYLCRRGYNDTARELAQQRGIEKLVDVDTFVTMSRIRDALLNQNVTEALAWCTENKKELRKMESKLEFNLRFQQYVELVRTESPDKLTDAIAYARKHILPFHTTHPQEVNSACGLLAYPPTHAFPGPYSRFYRPDRWNDLAELFTSTHNQLLALPSVPLLHLALSSGLSALKTPACHPQNRTRMPSIKEHGVIPGVTHGVCPICSTELNELARNVPYAHHTKSHVRNDLLALPNGNVFGKEFLDEYIRKSDLSNERVKDPISGNIFPTHEVRKIYIT